MSATRLPDQWALRWTFCWHATLVVFFFSGYQKWGHDGRPTTHQALPAIVIQNQVRRAPLGDNLNGCSTVVERGHIGHSLAVGYRTKCSPNGVHEWLSRVGRCAKPCRRATAMATPDYFLIVLVVLSYCCADRGLFFFCPTLGRGATN